MIDGRPLIRKLETLERLTDDEIERVIRLCRSVQTVARKSDIVSEGDRPEHVHIILNGWAGRYTIRKDGSRQFTAFLVAGDFCDIHTMALRKMDHSIVAITDCQIAYVDPAEIEEITRSTPVLTRALWRSTLVDEAILRRWIVNITSGDAFSTIAHLFCEMHLRLRAVGLVDDDRFAFPLTQEEIADATGMTSVHVNRTLKRMRDEGLIETEGRRLNILDVAALRQISGFDPNYLHMLVTDTVP